MNHQNNFFMGQPRYPHPQPRTPHHIHAPSNYEYDGRSRTVGPSHLFPRFNYSPNSNYQDLRVRQPFSPRCRFPPPPYYRQDQQWSGNVGTPRRRFPIPTSYPVQVPLHNNNAQFQNGFCPIRRHHPKPENNFQPQSQYASRTNTTRVPRAGYPRRVRHFTEVCASVNFTIRTGFEMTRAGIDGREEDRNPQQWPEEVHGVADEMLPADFGDDDEDTGEADIDSYDDNTVAVESDVNASPAAGSSSSETCFYDDEEENDNPEDDSDESTIQLSSQEEEYDPEEPKIHDLTETSTPIPSYSSESSNVTYSLQSRMASCDDEGFHEAFIGICISAYPSVLGRMLEVAGFGVWFSDGNKRNFSGVLKPDRPQNSKAVMIHGSALTVEAMKREGYSRIRINLETEYLNENVLDWIKKYMENPKAPPANWDEVKYHTEILELCKSATGMIIKWSHCSDTSLKKSGIEKAKHLAKKATDSYMKELRYLQEAVGTTSSS